MVFNDTPCLNFDNISDHPIIRRLKRKKFIEEFNLNKFKSDFDKLLSNFPSVDVPNYNFEKSDNSLKKKKNETENSEESSDSEDKYEDDESYYKNEEEKNDSIYEDKNKVKNGKYNQNKKEHYLFQDKKGMNNNYNYKNSEIIQSNKKNYKKNKFINNFIKDEKKKTERTVEDIVEYDPTNKKYAPFIKIIIDSINKKINNIQKGNLLQELSYKLANICIKIKDKYNFTPRPVQILAILRLADSIFNNDGKGSIGEIKTGEGKSFIVSTLAILLCQFGKKIDIVTSNIELASRDQKEQEKNFKLFGITSGVLFKEEEKIYLKGNNSYNIKIEQGYDLDVFKNQIVYSTNSNFEFVYLNSMFVSKPLRPYERKYDIVIVDEVDNMFIDQGTSPALLSEQCNIIHYEDILNVIYYNREKKVEIIKECVNYLLGGFATFDSGIGLNKINELKQAALASDRKIKNIDYIVYNGKVIIIDSNTGLKKPNSKWKDSIHEMVEIKEGISPDHNSVTYTAVTQHDFFNLYNKIVGVTGTVGTDKDRKDLKSIYGVEIFKCPRHFLREKKVKSTERPEGIDNIFISLNKEISKEIKKERPVLVIMNNIRNVDEYVLQSPFKDKISTIKGIEPEEDENSRNIAGQEGKITIATSAAGRGVDIKLSKNSLKNGGLHVIIPFLMPNQRALEQAAGRCGRQGQPGSVNIYNSKDDYYLMSKAFDQKEHNLWIIQNLLVETLHKNIPFIFEGEGKHSIQDLQLPCGVEIQNVFKICSFKISKSKIFEKKKEIISDYTLDMVKITWGYFFNELTKDDQCEDINYCKQKLKEYLSYLGEFIPKHSQADDYKKKLEIYNKLSTLSFGLLKIAADVITTIYCPYAKPAILGFINGGEEIVKSLINNEEINWGKVFIQVGKGCLDGLPINNKVLGTATKIIAPTIFDCAEGYFNGKKVNVVNSLSKNVIKQVSNGITKRMDKCFEEPVKNLFNNTTFNNQGFQSLSEKLHCMDRKLYKCLTKEVKNMCKNLGKSFIEEYNYESMYTFASYLDNGLNNFFLGNSPIEDNLLNRTKKNYKKKYGKDIKERLIKSFKEKKGGKSDIKKGLEEIYK